MRPLITYFVYLFSRPTYGMRKILEEKPSFKQIALFLFVVSTLRGIIEGIWVLLRVGQLEQVVTSWVLLKSYLRLGIPFIVSSITCGYVRWVGFALAPFLLGRFFGKQSRFEDWLRLSGFFMGLYLLAILPNFAYLVFKLPVIQFHISPIYNPGMGIGQVVTSIWLAVLLYKAARIIHGLPRVQTFLIGTSVPLLNVGALILGSMAFFNLPPLGVLPFRGAMNLATWVFILITLLVIPVFLWSGYRLDRRAQSMASERT